MSDKQKFIAETVKLLMYGGVRRQYEIAPEYAYQQAKKAADLVFPDED
jgi:hypothetical protein